MHESFVVLRRIETNNGKALMPGERWEPERPIPHNVARTLIRRGVIERVWVDPPKKRGRPPKKKAEVTA